jgi:signal peptide peptidase SppA
MKNLSRVASRFVNCPLMIHPPKLDVLVQALGPRFGITPVASLKSVEPFASAYAQEADDSDYQVIDGIAIIPIQGVLTKKESWMSAFSGCSSYDLIGRYLQDAVNDAAVRGILLQVDSPGGETTGCLELSDYIYSLRGAKPIYAIADDFAFSAAYALTSAADKIFVTRMGSVGSVGVVVLHVEDSKFNDQQGFKYTFIFQGAKKVDANPHEPLSERAEKDIQSEIDRQYKQFVETVARNRKADSEKIEGTEAGLYWAENAVPLLADEVGTFGDAMNALRKVIGEPVPSGQHAAGITATSSTAAIAAISNQKGVTNMDQETLPIAAEGNKPDDGNNNDDDSKFCHACGTKLLKGAKFCHACGTGAEGEGAGKFCHACGTELRKGAKFCHGCGEAVKGEAKKAEGQPAAPIPAASAAGAGALAEPINSRPEADIQAIGALCKMAGCPEKATEFLTKKKSTGQYFSVAEVSQALTESRVAESERHMITSHVDPNKTGAAGMRDLEAEAASFARQNRGQVTPALYVAGTSAKMTPERAVAQALESHPEVYESYRRQHNAAGLVRTLQDAGIELVQR